MDEGPDLVLTSNPLPLSLDKQTKDTANTQPLAEAEGQRRPPLISKRSQVNLLADDGHRQAKRSEWMRGRGPGRGPEAHHQHLSLVSN